MAGPASVQTQTPRQADQVGAVDAQFAGGGGPFVLVAGEGLADQLFLVGVDGFAQGQGVGLYDRVACRRLRLGGLLLLPLYHCVER